MHTWIPVGIVAYIREMAYVKITYIHEVFYEHVVYLR
jgi:uncharacterized membrane protein